MSGGKTVAIPGKRTQKVAYAALNGAYWMLYCVAAGFAGVFLLARGYTNSEIGLTMAMGHVLGLGLQPAMAAAADRAQTPVTVMGAMALAVILTLAAFLIVPGRGLFIAGTYVLFLALTVTFQPLVNAYAFYLERQGTAIPFGLCRAIGSLAYAVLSAVLGVIIARAGAGAAPVSGLCVIAAMAGLLIWFSRIKASAKPEKAERTSNNGGRTDSRFILFLTGTALIFISHAFLNNFTIQIVRNVGGDSGDMGLLGAYMAALELPAMMLFDRLHRRFSCTGMLRVAAVFFAVKCVLTLAAGSMPGLYGAMLFQALSFALFVPASVRYAGELAQGENVNRLQAGITAMISVGNIGASLGGGVLIDRMGMKPALTVASVCACAGMLIMQTGLKRRSNYGL